MRLALYQPDIPQNTGTILRLAACLGLAVDIIGPAGFDMTDRNLRRAGMDYLAAIDLTRHLSWERYLESRGGGGAEGAGGQRDAGRLVLLTTAAETSYLDFAFAPGDTLLLGRESAGAPPNVHATADARIKIPLRPGFRSLNIAVAAAMVVGEAMRQVERYGECQ